MAKIRKLLEWIVSNAKLVIIIIAVITVFFGVFLFKVKIENPAEKILIKDLPSKKFYDKFIEMFGKDEVIIIVVKYEPGIFEPTAMEAIDFLTTAITGNEKIKGINEKLQEKLKDKSIKPIVRVVSLTLLWQESKKQLAIWKKSPLFKALLKDLETEEQQLEFFRNGIQRTKLFEKNLVAEDGKAAAITLIVQSHKDEVVAYIDEDIREAEEKYPEVKIYQIGSPVIANRVITYLRGDLQKLSKFAIILIVIILFICFHSVRGIALPLLTSGVAFIWTFGLMGLVGASITMVTIVVPTLLIAIGNAYALHVVSEFFEETEEGRGLKKDIVTRSLFKVSLPVFLAAATTIIGFASLALNKIDMIREFSLFSCFGLFSILIISLTLLPALLVVIKLPKIKRAEKKKFIEVVLEKVVRFDLKHRRLVYLFGAAIITLSIIGIWKIRVENSVIGYFKKNQDLRINFEDIHKTLAGTYPLNIVMSSKEKDYFKDPDILRKIERFQEDLENPEKFPGIDKTTSIVDYVKTANIRLSGFDFKKQVIPETKEDVENIISKFPLIFGEDQRDIKAFATLPDYSNINIVCRTHVDGAKKLLRLEKKILNYCRKNFSKDLDVHVTGFPIVVGHSTQEITKGQVRSLSLAFICVFIIMTLLFLSIKVGIVAMIPNMFPILVNFGIMGWFGIALSSATSMIASIALGIAVDDTIHYLTKYNAEFKKDWDKKRSMRDTILTVGQPIMFTSFTLGLGFSVLLFSNFTPTMLFGLMMVITMGTALLGDLIILPVLMLRTELVTLWDFVALKLGEEPRKSIALFDRFSKWQAKKVLVAGLLEQYRKGTVIFREGELGDTMYAVISGKVRVIREQEGQEKLITSLGRGEIFGEMALVMKKERNATVIADEDTELLHINDATLTRLRRRFPRIASKFYHNLTKILCQRLEITTARLFR